MARNYIQKAPDGTVTLYVNANLPVGPISSPPSPSIEVIDVTFTEVEKDYLTAGVENRTPYREISSGVLQGQAVEKWVPKIASWVLDPFLSVKSSPCQNYSLNQLAQLAEVKEGELKTRLRDLNAAQRIVEFQSAVTTFSVVAAAAALVSGGLSLAAKPLFYALTVAAGEQLQRRLLANSEAEVRALLLSEIARKPGLEVRIDPIFSTCSITASPQDSPSLDPGEGEKGPCLSAILGRSDLGNFFLRVPTGPKVLSVSLWRGGVQIQVVNGPFTPPFTLPCDPVDEEAYKTFHAELLLEGGDSFAVPLSALEEDPSPHPEDFPLQVRRQSPQAVLLWRDLDLENAKYGESTWHQILPGEFSSTNWIWPPDYQKGPYQILAILPSNARVTFYCSPLERDSLVNWLNQVYGTGQFVLREGRITSNDRNTTARIRAVRVTYFPQGRSGGMPAWVLKRGRPSF